MFRFCKCALMSALIAAAVAAPLSGMAATPVPHDVRQNSCKLVIAPFAAHKTPYRSSQYVCRGVAYSVSDPRLARASDTPADGGQGAMARNGGGVRPE